MDQQQAMERLCRLGGEVMHRQFDCRHASDCFCGHGGFSNVDPPYRPNFDYSEEIMAFIEAAVEARLVQNGK